MNIVCLEQRKTIPFNVIENRENKYWEWTYRECTNIESGVKEKSYQGMLII